MTELYNYYVDGVSNCCGAKVIISDICADCKEHCEVIGEPEDD